MKKELNLELLLKAIEDPELKELFRTSFYKIYKGDFESIPVQFSVVSATLAQIQLKSLQTAAENFEAYKKEFETFQQEKEKWLTAQNKHSILLRSLITFVGMLIFAVGFMTWKMDQVDPPMVDSDFEGAFYIDFSKMPSNTLRNHETGIYRLFFEDEKKGKEDE